MNTHRKITCTCTRCGRNENIERPQIITEEQRKEAEDLSLFKWKCPECQHILKLLYPCIYMNQSKKLLIFYTDRRGEVHEQEEDIIYDIQKETKGYSKRICNTLEEFGEKIRVLEQGLDDRTIELLKIMTFARVHLTDPTLKEIYFYRKNEFGALEFTIFNEEGPRGITIPENMYREIRLLVEEKLEETQDQFYCIDLNWAGEQIVKMNEA